MPELPEVESMVRAVRSVTAGQIISHCEFVDPTLPHGVSPRFVIERLRGAHVTNVTRSGKWVIIRLDPPRGTIVIQPRMSGGFWLRPPARPEHVRLWFEMKRSGKRVWFSDTRRLGKLHWFADDAAFAVARDRSHADDALQIALEALGPRLKRTNRPIKAALIDQKVVAGIGNIYADEILWTASIHPSRRASTLTRRECAAIHAAIRPILDKAIAAEGSSFDSAYRTVLGDEGGYLPQAAVHRSDRPCPRCDATIVKTRIPGLITRPTYFCPRCQRNRTNAK